MKLLIGNQLIEMPLFLINQEWLHNNENKMNIHNHNHNHNH